MVNPMKNTGRPCKPSSPGPDTKQCRVCLRWLPRSSMHGYRCWTCRRGSGANLGVATNICACGASCFGEMCGNCQKKLNRKLNKKEKAWHEIWLHCRECGTTDFDHWDAGICAGCMGMKATLKAFDREIEPNEIWDQIQAKARGIPASCRPQFADGTYTLPTPENTKVSCKEHSNIFCRDQRGGAITQ